MRENERLVTIGRYETVFDAEVAKMALENEGIECTLAGCDLMVNMPYPNVVNVELQVFEVDVERATEVLDRIEPMDESDDAAAEDGQ